MPLGCRWRYWQDFYLVRSGCGDQLTIKVHAVGKAVEEIKRHADGHEVLAVVKLVDWDRSHGTEGAALKLHMSERTARSRRECFIYAVARNIGYL